MANICYRLTRDDGEELGVFGRRDEAQRVAEYDARSRGYELRWAAYLGGMHGKPTTSGQNVFKYAIKDVECS